jgi:hypothetical protein
MEGISKQEHEEISAPIQQENPAENNPWHFDEGHSGLEHVAILREDIADLEDRLESLDDVHADYIRKKWARKIGRILLVSGVVTAIFGGGIGNEGVETAGRFLAFFSFPGNGYGGIIAPRPD